jgi:raffinose/stachyose/melibiose transport system substrate-binding protein
MSDIGRSRRWRSVGVIAIGCVTATALSCSDSDESGSGDRVTLRVINYRPEDAAYFEEINAAFEAANPGIDVAYDAVPTAQYSQLLTARLTTGDADVVGLLEGSNKAPDVGPRLADLAGQSFITSFSPETLAQGEGIDGRQVLMPSSVTGVVVFYNRDEFTRLGLEVPATWSDFVAVAEAIKADGQTPIVFGGKDQWPVNMLLLGLEPGVVRAARPTFWDDLATGGSRLDDPAWVEVFSKLRTIGSFLEPNFAGVAYSQAPGLFAVGSAVMMIDGAWSASEITNAEPDFDVGVFVLPGSDDPSANPAPTKIGGGWGVVESSAQRDAAMAYVAFLAEPSNYARYIETSKLLPAQPGVEVSDPLSVEISELFAGDSTPLFEVLRIPGAAYDYTPNAMEVLLGSKTPEVAAADFQSTFIESTPQWEVEP